MCLSNGGEEGCAVDARLEINNNRTWFRFSFAADPVVERASELFKIREKSKHLKNN